MTKFAVMASELKSLKKSIEDKKLAELKKEIIEILKKQDEKEFKKAIDYFESQELHFTHLEKSLSGKWIQKAGYGIGTVRVWKGKKYKKIAPDKWVRIFDKEGRGTNIAIGKLIAKVQKIDNVEDLMAFVQANKQRFVDENGMDLPVLDKLRAAVDAKNNGSMGSSKPAAKETSKPAETKTASSSDEKKYKKTKKMLEDTIAEIDRNIKMFDSNPSPNSLRMAKQLEKQKAERQKQLDDLESAYKKLSEKPVENTDGKYDRELVDSWKDDYKDFSTDVLKEKIEEYTKVLERAKNDNPSPDQRVAVKQNEHRLKALNELLEEKKNKPAEKTTKKTFKQEMNELYDAQDKAWEGFESGSDIKSSPENSKKFYERVKKFVDDNNIKLSQKHYDELEESNGHSFNEALELAGAYGEEKKEKALAKNREYSQKYKGQILDLSMIDEFKESDDDNNTYWIQDSRGNRLTNEDAKKRIQSNLSKIIELESGDEPRKDMKIRDLKLDNEYLKERLNPDDRKEFVSKVKKSLFDGFLGLELLEEDINDEEKDKEEESLWNDYSAEEPDDFNSIELQVREAMNRHYSNCL